MSDEPSEGSQPPWDSFRGHQNTAKILAQKAEVVSSLILYSLEVPWDLIRNRGGSILGADEIKRREFCDLETAALYLRLVEEISSSCLSRDAYESLNDELLIRISQKLATRLSEDTVGWTPYLIERFDQYAAYKEWIVKPGESQGGTLLWEYAKTIAAISGIEKDAAFNLSLISLLLSSFRGWELRELLNDTIGPENK